MHDYLQLAFGEQMGLSIYNEVSLTPESMRWEQLVGNTVLSVAEGDSFIEPMFLDGARICIDMRPQAWRGPEAIQLNRQGQPTVIWNVCIRPRPGIETDPDGIFLFRFAADGQVVGDTWHETIEEAQEQATFEFENSLSDWITVPVVAFALGRNDTDHEDRSD